MSDTNAAAIIEDGQIVIRIPLDCLPAVIEGAYACRALDQRWKITDATAFAKEFVRELNREDEEGTTPLHQCFDRAINKAIDNGAEGIELHEDQEA